MTSGYSTSALGLVNAVLACGAHVNEDDALRRMEAVFLIRARHYLSEPPTTPEDYIYTIKAATLLATSLQCRGRTVEARHYSSSTSPYQSEKIPNHLP